MVSSNMGDVKLNHNLKNNILYNLITLMDNFYSGSNINGLDIILVLPCWYALSLLVVSERCMNISMSSQNAIFKADVL